jgi:hypothetical protein
MTVTLPSCKQVSVLFNHLAASMLAYRADHQVELVEITVYQSVFRKLHQDGHEPGKQRAWLVNGCHVTEGKAINQLHDQAVSAEVNGLRHWEASCIQHL